MSRKKQEIPEGCVRTSVEDKAKIAAVVSAAAKEAERMQLPGFALIVVLDEDEPLLSGAVAVRSAEALAALMAYGPTQLRGTLCRTAGISEGDFAKAEEEAAEEHAALQRAKGKPS